MFNWFKPKKIYALSELRRIVSILFPPIEKAEFPFRSENGLEEERVVFVDKSVDSNLELCIINIQDGTAGSETLESLRYILKQLRQVRSILDETTYIPNGTYYVVDTPNQDVPLENIKINSKD